MLASPQERPLREDTVARLYQRWRQALTARDGVAGAHCIHELWMRGENGGTIDELLELLWKHATGAVPEWLPMRHFDWLPLAYEVAGRFAGRPRGRANIYLILLDYTDSPQGPFGVYVGMSRYTALQRFDQHKAGIRHSGSVLKRGLEVITGPVLHLQGLARAHAGVVEKQLAEALQVAGIKVKGGH
jgi:hypothetical protein